MLCGVSLKERGHLQGAPGMYKTSSLLKQVCSLAISSVLSIAAFKQCVKLLKIDREVTMEASSALKTHLVGDSLLCGVAMAS